MVSRALWNRGETTAPVKDPVHPALWPMSSTAFVYRSPPREVIAAPPARRAASWASIPDPRGVYWEGL